MILRNAVFLYLLLYTCIVLLCTVLIGKNQNATINKNAFKVLLIFIFHFASVTDTVRCGKGALRDWGISKIIEDVSTYLLNRLG